MNEKYTDMISLNLYTTLGCHLCEDAKGVIGWVQENVSTPLPKIELNEIDIAESEDLVERYGVLIPVVQGKVNGDSIELKWPFNPEDFYYFIQKFISNNGSETC